MGSAAEQNLVLYEENSGLRKVILNRPKKLNSLNYEMVLQMLKKFQVYEKDPSVKLVILKGNGKAFCAGGDVSAALVLATAGHWCLTASFYRIQLSLDYVLGTYRKPLVSILHGAIMGGGAGLSMNATFRIVTENSVFAMPEASIGLFPDVGASHFLSKLPGSLGEYLGLSGARLNGAEMLACGLATHFVLSKDLHSLENALQQHVNTSDISKIIDKFVSEVHVRQSSPCTSLQIINECFSMNTVEEILSSLENIVANGAEKWAVEAVNYMKSSSPTSLKIFLRSIREGRKEKFEDCLVREYNIFCHVLRRTVNYDFYEGSRAMLIEKDKKPKWQPPKLELVTEEMVGQFFKKVDDEEFVDLKLPMRSGKVFTLLPKL